MKQNKEMANAHAQSLEWERLTSTLNVVVCSLDSDCRFDWASHGVFIYLFIFLTASYILNKMKKFLYEKIIYTLNSQEIALFYLVSESF